MRIIPCILMLTLLAGSAHGEGEKTGKGVSHISGSSFLEGVAAEGPTVYHRDGSVPAVRLEGPPPEERLPKGTGGVVAYCYIQSSGGKLSSQSGNRPVAGAAVEFRQGGRRVVMRTDDNGYVVAALPAGEYEMSVQGMVRKVALEKGKTLLLPVRVGKRMVD